MSMDILATSKSTGTQLATNEAFKNSRHTHQNTLKPSPVSERSAYPLQNYVCFSPGLESFGHKFTLTGPGLKPTVQNSS